MAIGISGAGTLDKVAGPVGEALIMTAIGLAVAIPAVLGYNFIVRANRVTLSQLDAFAHDLFAFLATGTKFDPRSEEHTSELQSLMRISYAVFCLKKKNTRHHQTNS